MNNAFLEGCGVCGSNAAIEYQYITNSVHDYVHDFAPKSIIVIHLQCNCIAFAPKIKM